MKKSVKKLLSCIVVFSLLLSLFSVSAFADEPEPQGEQYTLEYSSHVQNIGWQEAVGNGEISGTSGMSYRLESMKIQVNKETAGVVEKVENAINYQVHVQNKGWIDPVADGNEAGTTGQSLRLEAIRINLGEALSSEYDIYYKVHAQNIGWMGWAKNGETAGTSGMSYRLEAIVIKLVKKGEPAPETESDQYALSYVSPECKGLITYQAHVQNYGWMTSVADGASAGTQGEGLRMESLKIWVNNPTDDTGNVIEGGISCEAHVQNNGWMPAVGEGEIIGTTGESKRVEAIKLSLTGALAEQYDVYYRVHCQNFGTLDWAKNGEPAGTAGCSYRIESIEIKMFKHGDPNIPSQEGMSFFDKNCVPGLVYQVNIKDGEWQDAVTSGEIAGTIGEKKALDSLKINIDTSQTGKYTGGIEYSVYVSNDGWLTAASDGAEAGTPGSGKKIEAVKISLTGELAECCDVYYQAHVEEYGWLGWAKNGQEAGTSVGYRIEALRIVLAPKGLAPGSTSNYFMTYKKNDIAGMNPTMWNRIKNESSGTHYLICCDCHENRVGIFTGSAGNWQLQYYWMCTTGAGETPTIKGTFYVTDKVPNFSGVNDGIKYTCWYATRISGNYLFHSVLYRQASSPVEIVDGRLGMDLSHGCVRLALENAKWMYDNIPSGTTIIIY